MMQTNNMKSNITRDHLSPIVHIDKPEPRPNDRVSLSRHNTIEAQELLSPEAFFLYMFFALCSDKSAVQFSASKFCDDYGWPRGLYMDAYNELLSNEYLMTTTEESNMLFFHDDPYVPIYLYGWHGDDEGEKTEVDW